MRLILADWRGHPSRLARTIARMPALVDSFSLGHASMIDPRSELNVRQVRRILRRLIANLRFSGYFRGWFDSHALPPFYLAQHRIPPHQLA